MKTAFLVTLMLFLSKFVLAQDLTDEKDFKKLSGIAQYTHDKGNYRATLRDKSNLKIEYHVLVADQYNAEYSFSSPSNVNLSFSLDNALKMLNSYAKVLKLSPAQISSIQTQLILNKSDFKKKYVLADISSSDYDEAEVVYKTIDGRMVCSFFFMRML